MSFTNIRFIAFFCLVYLGLWVIKGICHICKKEYRFIYQLFLLVVSYIFLAFFDWRFCLCLFAVTIVTYLSTLRIDAVRMNPKAAKMWLVFGVIFALIMLGVFKYFNFFYWSMGILLKQDNIRVFNILLPVGISFYVFSSIGYMMDVYRKKYTACKDFVQVALYMGFFPKLVSGPLVRANDFFEQLRENRMVSIKNLEAGIQIFVLGLFKKMVLADHLAVFVDDVFAAPLAFDQLTCILAVVSYSLQIYFDFAGYSDIAIGVAKMCGYDFKPNFNLPYLSGNLTEFWKRWHISLSSWLQEYLYFSLGGNRRGTKKTYVNLVLTMLLGGFWHGANWTFVIWGGLHGIGLVLHKLFVKWKKKARGDVHTNNPVWNVISVLFTFATVSVCWVFFRADSVEGATKVLKGMVIARDGIRQLYSWTFFSIIILIVVTVVAVVKWKKTVQKEKPDEERSAKQKGKMNTADGFYPVLDLDKIVNLVVFFVFCGITLGMAYFGNTVFIYGKF